MKTFQFRLYPTRKQTKAIDRQIEQHRLLYNHCLELKIKTYQENNVSLSCYDLINVQIPLFKTGCNYSSLQQTVRRLDKAYSAFFKKNSKFPRFKGFGRFRTIQYSVYGDGCKIKDETVYFQHIGKVYCKFHREIEGRIKTLSISKHKDIYFVSIYTDELTEVELSTGDSVGIDFGVKTTATLSDGQQYSTPRFTKSQAKETSRLQRGKKWKAYNKHCDKIRNRRKDHNHKLSRKIVNQYDIICLENLKSSEIMSYPDVNSRICDIAIRQLINFITYKAENAGKTVVLVDPAYTTQICSDCGKIEPKTLKERIHNCPCGCTLDRDVNAARNILRIGLDSLVLTP